jgi:hypothetical protein
LQVLAITTYARDIETYCNFISRKGIEIPREDLIDTLIAFLKHNNVYESKSFESLTPLFFQRLKQQSIDNIRQIEQTHGRRLNISYAFNPLHSREYMAFVNPQYDAFTADYYNHEYLVTAMYKAHAYLCDLPGDRHGGVIVLGKSGTGKSTMAKMDM